MEDSEEMGEKNDFNEMGYYLRSKRPRLEESSGASEEIVEHCGGLKRRSPIMFVPTEIILKIFNYLECNELSNKVRLVNKRFRYLAEHVLNLKFKQIENQIDALIKTTHTSLQCTEDDMELKCLNKMLNMLELLCLQHSIIKATIWRYVYNEYYPVQKTCAYAGIIIDAFEAFIWKYVHIPNKLYANCIIREQSFPVEVTNIVHMTKVFCVYFDKVSEEFGQHSLINSGCKAVDILDCGAFAQKTTFYEKLSNELFSAKYSYFFRYAWFISLPITMGKPMTWAQKQRMMHMRLRRIVLAHTDMFLQQSQYKRELLVRPNPIRPIRKPGSNVYTGYGDVENIFYYYGVMNEGAYIQKFRLEEDNGEEMDDDEEEQENLNNENERNPLNGDGSDEFLYRIPPLGVRIDVVVKCPAAYAPLRFLKCTQVPLKLRKKRKKRDCTHINLTFDCYGAYYTRLPIKCEYDFMSSRDT